MKLAFGQTPWDLLPDETLLKHLDQMLQTLTEASLYLDIAYETHHQGAPAFWNSSEGRGARGREIIQQALARATQARNTRNDVLRTIFALYIGIENAADLAIACEFNQNSIWLKKLNQLLYRDDEAKHLYGGFSRYAIDLLFEDRNDILVRKEWLVCPCCKHVIADGIRKTDSRMRPGAIHKDISRIAPDCCGVMRSYTWTDLNRPDLEPEKENA